MQRLMLVNLSAAASLVLLVTVLPAKALVIRPNPLPTRAALADCVVVGKVTAIEKTKVMARQFRGAEEKMEYQVAVVKISEAPVGLKGLTHVRIGFLTPREPPGGPRLRPGRFMPQPPKVGDEACFFLNKHFEESFYVAAGFNDQINKKDNPNFDKEIAVVRRAAKLLEKPSDSLRSKNADERVTVAAMLIARYRTPKGVFTGEPKREPIDAEESKLILEALASAEWKNPEDFNHVSAQLAFGQLGLSEKDSWKPGPFKNFAEEYPPAAKKWLRENAGTYRIERFVPEKTPAEK